MSMPDIVCEDEGGGEEWCLNQQVIKARDVLYEE
jgi:hypothetical protein